MCSSQQRVSVGSEDISPTVADSSVDVCIEDTTAGSDKLSDDIMRYELIRSRRRLAESRALFDSIVGASEGFLRRTRAQSPLSPSDLPAGVPTHFPHIPPRPMEFLPEPVHEILSEEDDNNA